ncbi:hypothetical protein CA984_23750 [Streptosporangium minutum]|uniref:Uncharacterized protein n=1 Tax=Streptosporangium minutum TaxID=569862 RepID=A0A2C9ZLP2_9ACTN|nr:hypothetical protein CA984_23750 [Streptosporangium minutum]
MRATIDFSIPQSATPALPDAEQSRIHILYGARLCAPFERDASATAARPERSCRDCFSLPEAAGGRKGSGYGGHAVRRDTDARRWVGGAAGV